MLFEFGNVSYVANIIVTTFNGCACFHFYASLFIILYIAQQNIQHSTVIFYSPSVEMFSCFFPIFFVFFLFLFCFIYYFIALHFILYDCELWMHFIENICRKILLLLVRAVVSQYIYANLLNICPNRRRWQQHHQQT